VVILGILIAIAIPLYLNYTKSAKDKAASTDLRNAITAIEACNTDNSVYPTSITSAGAITSTPTCTQVINLTAGTTFTYAAVAAAGTTAAGFIAVTYNAAGAGKSWCYGSGASGAIKQEAASYSPPATGICA